MATIEELERRIADLEGQMQALRQGTRARLDSMASGQGTLFRMLVEVQAEVKGLSMEMVAHFGKIDARLERLEDRLTAVEGELGQQKAVLASHTVLLQKILDRLPEQ